MITITIENIKNIAKMQFSIPTTSGVYLLVGANGVGKTTLLVCLDRICNPNAFARGFSTSRYHNEVDQYSNSSITYDRTESNVRVHFRKSSKRWAASPKGSSRLLSDFGFTQSIFIRADSNRIDIPKDEIKRGQFVSAAQEIKKVLNDIFETNKYNKLKRLKNTHGRGKQSTYFYVIEENSNHYYSEKRFSTGELALLRLVEKITFAENGALVLLDEAEIALHPRVQKKLLDYLNKVAIEKELKVLISTHSITMIKSTDKSHIISLENKGDGNYEAITPCYPAKAIGNVDFMENVIYDSIFFVEDDMARLLLKKMIKKCCENDQRFATITNCIVPVGGYEQTALLAINTKQQLFNRSKVFAVLDADVFEEAISNNQKFSKLYNDNRDTICNLGCTPEVWMIEKIEDNSSDISNKIRNSFRIETISITESDEYKSCNSSKLRKLAKQKIDVVVNKLSESCGDNKEVVLEKLAQILVDNVYTINDIKRIVAPMLNNTN